MDPFWDMDMVQENCPLRLVLQDIENISSGLIGESIKLWNSITIILLILVIY